VVEMVRVVKTVGCGAARRRTECQIAERLGGNFLKGSFSLFPKKPLFKNFDDMPNATL